MRIALIEPYFIVGLGYQSMGWYEAFVGQGHQVRVFSTCRINAAVRHLYCKEYPEGLTSYNGGEILRLPSVALPRNMIYCPSLFTAVLEYAPELTLLVYPGSFFARDLIANRSLLPGILVTTYGENSAQHRWGGAAWQDIMKSLMLRTAFFLIKRRFYRRAMEASDLVLLQTPDTFRHLLPQVASPSKRRKILAHGALSPLGFSAKTFYVDEIARKDRRAQLGITVDDVAALYACKITPAKRLDLWVMLMSRVMRRLPRLKSILVGMRDNDEASRAVRGWISDSGLSHRFICLPLASREELRDIANAADIGVWHLQPAVTIQEVMGTGLYMILANSPTMNHLVNEPETGRKFAENNWAEAEEVMVDAVNMFCKKDGMAAIEARCRRSEINAGRFSYEALTRKLEEVVQKPSAASLIMRYGNPVDVDMRDALDGA